MIRSPLDIDRAGKHFPFYLRLPTPQRMPRLISGHGDLVGKEQDVSVPHIRFPRKGREFVLYCGAYLSDKETVECMGGTVV